MRNIKIKEEEYTLEFTFAAAEHKNLVQAMFNVLSGAYIIKNDDMTEEGKVKAMIDGMGDMVADIPHIVKTAFYAGLLEHYNLTEEEAHKALKLYMIENKLSYRAVFEDIKKYMEEDGFFELSGLTEVINEMNQSMEEEPKQAKTPQDHKKKQTSTK